MVDRASKLFFQTVARRLQLPSFLILGLGKTAYLPPIAGSQRESLPDSIQALQFSILPKIWYWKSKDPSRLQYDHLSTGPDLLQLIDRLQSPTQYQASRIASWAVLCLSNN